MKKHIVFLSVLVVCFISAAIGGSTAAAFEDRSQEITQYLEMLQSDDINNRIEAAKLITRSSITDAQLYDFIDGELLDSYLQSAGNPLHDDLMSWYCKALAASGMPAYKETLQKVAQNAPSLKLQKYAAQSLAKIEEYARRNEIMTDSSFADADLAPEILRLINMLKSDMAALKRDAAKTIVRSGSSDPIVYEVVNQELLNGYLAASDDKTHIDAMAWLCKALAASGISEYSNTLEEVASNAPNGKLRKYAAQSYRMLK